MSSDTVLYAFDVGIHFEKDKGQHILKNPLIVNSMIEKVCMPMYINNTFI